MMSAKNYVMDAGSGVAQYKKLCVRGLDRGSRSKSKRQFPPASPYGSSTNVLATRLERRMEAAQNNRTQDKVAHSWVNHHQLLFANWNIQLELVEKAKRGSGTVNLDGRWKLFYSGADPSVFAQAGVEILTSPPLSDYMSDWVSLGSRVAY